jgi:choline dehydrogenase
MSLRGGKHDWTYKHNMINAPDYQHLEMKNTRGKVLGGSSSLNYFTWLPCSGAIYDEWAQFGGDNWNYKNCRSISRRSVTSILVKLVLAN